jgi:hypothetical protein
MRVKNQNTVMESTLMYLEIFENEKRAGRVLQHNERATINKSLTSFEDALHNIAVRVLKRRTEQEKINYVR